MNTISAYCDCKPFTMRKEFDLTAEDFAFLCAHPKGIEKTAKMALSFFSCFDWFCHKFELVFTETKVICIAATQATLKSVAETLGAFHIFGSGQELCKEFSNARITDKIALVFLTISDAFETLLYLQKQMVIDKITASYWLIKPVIDFFACIALKTGRHRVFMIVLAATSKITANHIKCWTQVIGVGFGLVELFKIFANPSEEAKRVSCFLKIASDVGKLGLIVFSGSLGFWAGYTGTFAFRFILALPATIVPVIRLVYNHRYPAFKA